MDVPASIGSMLSVNAHVLACMVAIVLPPTRSLRLSSMQKQQPVRKAATKVGPNDPCPCGSGKKYKKCCMQKDKASGMEQ